MKQQTAKLLDRREIDIPEIERRFLRACKTIRVLPDRERKFHDVRTAWPEYVNLKEEAYGYSEVEVPRFRPTRFDVGDVLDALAWARGLQPPEFRLLWWRSFDVSFFQIAKRIGRSDETARRRYKDAVIHLWAVANHRYAQPLRATA